MDRAVAKPQRQRRDRVMILDKVFKILEFAWGTGVLDLSADEFAEGMEILFPDKFRSDPHVQKRIAQLRAEKILKTNLS